MSLSEQVKVVVFDKTGTLTYGRPEVNCVITTVPDSTLPLQHFVAMLGLAESSSEHPLGIAISSFAKKVRTCICSCYMYTTCTHVRGVCMWGKECLCVFHGSLY